MYVGRYDASESLDQGHVVDKKWKRAPILARTPQPHFIEISKLARGTEQKYSVIPDVFSKLSRSPDAHSNFFLNTGRIRLKVFVGNSRSEA